MRWLRRNLTYIAVFGGLAATIGAVSLLALIDSAAFSGHVWFRSLLHVPWGFALCILFFRLLMLVETERGKLFRWQAWYGIPIAVVFGIAIMQEFGFPGDFRNAVGWVHRAKSFADVAGWAFGALSAAWFAYFCGDRLSTARWDYIAWRRARRKP